MLAVHAKGEEMGTTLFDRRYSDSPMTYLTFRGPLLLLPNQTATTKTSIVTPSDTIRVLLQKRTLPHCYLFPCTCLLPFIGRCYFFFGFLLKPKPEVPKMLRLRSVITYNHSKFVMAVGYDGASSGLS